MFILLPNTKKDYNLFYGKILGVWDILIFIRERSEHRDT